MSQTEQPSHEGPSTGAARNPRRLSLRSNIAYTGVGLAVYYLSQYLILALIAKLSTASTLGQYSLGLAVTTPIIVFSQMQFRQVQVTDANGEFRFSDYFWTRLLGTFVALLVILGTALFARYSADMQAVILLLGLSKAFESVSDLAYGNLQKHDRMDKVAFSMGLRGVLGCIAFGAALRLTSSLPMAIGGLTLSWLAVLVAYDLPLSLRISGQKEPLERPTLAPMIKLLRMGFVIAITSTLLSFGSNLPRYYLDIYQSREAVGLYSAATTALVFMSMLASSLTQGTLVRATSYLKSGESAALLRLYVKIGGLVIAVGIAFIGVLALFGKPIVSLLFRPSYVSIVVPMIIMTTGITVGALGAIGSQLLTVARKFDLWLYCTVALTLFQIPVCQVLIQRYGLVGAAWSEALRYAFSMLLLNLAAYWLYKKRGVLSLNPDEPAGASANAAK